MYYYIIALTGLRPSEVIWLRSDSVPDPEITNRTTSLCGRIKCPTVHVGHVIAFKTLPLIHFL